MAVTYMSDVATDLAALDEEVESLHPLVRAEAGLARKVVEMGHEAGHEIYEARIVGLRVDSVCVGRDVVDCQVQKRGRGGGFPVTVGLRGHDDEDVWSLSEEEGSGSWFCPAVRNQTLRV